MFQRSKKLPFALFSLVVLATLTLPEQALATWQFDTFKSGSLHHQVAASAPQKNGRELEVFCSATKPGLTLALYLPDQRFRRRDAVRISLQVDRKRTWNLKATRHAMAIIAPGVSSQIIQDLSSGNRARITFPVSAQSKQTEVFPLRRSSAALARVVERCG